MVSPLIVILKLDKQLCITLSDTTMYLLLMICDRNCILQSAVIRTLSYSMF